MRQLEGGWISTKAVERSKTRLRRLGYFEDVNVETPSVPGTPDQVDVNFTVKERPSGKTPEAVRQARCPRCPRSPATRLAFDFVKVVQRHP